MNQLVYKFEKVYIDKASRGSEVAERAVAYFSPAQVEWVTARPFPESHGELSAREFSRSKRHLFLTEYQGQFFKRCPGSRPGLTCCNYFVLNLGLQCDMNCSYCYLQSFINTPVMTVYTNIEQALSELKELADPQMKFRIGTGEVIDSLSLDELTLYSRRLIGFFQDFPQWRLEFKTKSDKVDQFLDVAHAGNVIVSWSLNPTKIVNEEEHGTASLAARLNAAEKCLKKGFQVSFHIDPVIWHEGWKESYAELVDTLASRFAPHQTPYLSLGALRFQPEQRHMMRERFGMKSAVTSAEMHTGKDGKMRYDQNLRQEMFDFIIQRFKGHNPAWNIFLCMENPETWLGTFSAMPKKVEGLAELFDHQVTRSITAARSEILNTQRATSEVFD